MKIETKYNIGGEVWVNDNGTPRKCRVKYIEVLALELMGTTIKYKVLSYEPPIREALLFATEEELLKSL
jgi:hypothetical protein